MIYPPLLERQLIPQSEQKVTVCIETGRYSKRPFSSRFTDVLELG